MFNIAKIALRNLRRYRRRSALTVSLIAVGVIFMLVFVSVSGSFKELMISDITKSYLGDLQIHRRGYVAAIESLPLNLNLTSEEFYRVAAVLQSMPEVAAFSERIKFGALFSNFAETTNVRVNGVYPEKEFSVSTQMLSRITQGEKNLAALQPGKILVPELLARGFNTKVGDTVVIVATNKDGSVNGKTLLVSGILASVTGPGGRDAYIHLEDAMQILRMQTKEVSEIAVSVKALGHVDKVAETIRAQLGSETQKPRVRSAHLVPAVTVREHRQDAFMIASPPSQSASCKIFMT